VAGSAGSLIEDRTQPVFYRFHVQELILAGVEEHQFLIAQPWEGIAE